MVVVDIFNLNMNRYLFAETSDLGPGGRDSARPHGLVLPTLFRKFESSLNQSLGGSLVGNLRIANSIALDSDSDVATL